MTPLCLSLQEALVTAGLSEEQAKALMEVVSAPDTRFVHVEEQVASLERRMAILEALLTILETRITGTQDRLSRVEHRLPWLYTSLGGTLLLALGLLWHVLT